MKVSQKLLTLGIGIILITGFSVYLFSEYQSEKIEASNVRMRLASEISQKSIAAQVAINNFQLNDILDESYFEEGRSANLEDYRRLISELKSRGEVFFSLYDEEDAGETKELFTALLNRLENAAEALVEAYTVLGFNDYGLENSFSETRDLMEDNFVPVDEAAFALAIEYLAVQEMKFVHRKLDKYVDKARSGLEEALEVIEEKEEFQVLIDEYIGHMDAYRRQYTLIGLTRDEGLRGNMEREISAFENLLNRLSENSAHAVSRDSRRKTFFGLLFIIAGIAVSSVIFIFLSRHVTEPLRFLSLSASRIADGDLTSEIPSALTRRRDEIGLLSRALNHTVENLRNAVLRIKTSSDENRVVGESLRTKADQTSFSAGSVTKQLTGFTHLFGDLDQSIFRSENASGRIREHSVGLGERISGQVVVVEEAGAIIEEMSANMTSIANITAAKKRIASTLVEITKEGDAMVTETNRIIKQISESTGQMKSLTDLINGIASQTNLLSMNAAIEAAHAGEAGKGFGVVAEEIRKLSENTAEAVKGISVYLSSVIQRINEAQTASELSGKAFLRMTEGVADSAEAFDSIARMISEASLGSEGMVRAVSQINEVTGDVRAGADEILQIVETLGADMKEVTALSSRGKVEIYSSLESVKTISKNTGGVAELSISNEKIIERLTELVTRFKLPDSPESN